MRILLLLFLPFIALPRLCAINEIGDSLVKYQDLKLKWETERDVLHAFVTNQKYEAATLFLKSYSKDYGLNASKVNERIMECVTELKEKIKDQTEPKAIKTIYKEVHRRFFKVYKHDNSFSDIFEKGEYNCVSGSALYALIFQKLNIPFQIMEAPQHVYLVAYPTTHKILIETTSPHHGYFKFQQDYIDKFILYLVNSKLISQDEANASNANELFNKYYFKKNGLSLVELVAIQYTNYALYHLDKNEFDAALIEIQKAYYMSPNEKNRYLLKTILDHLVTNNDYKQFKQVAYLEGLCAFNNFSKDEISNEKIKYEFTRVMRSQLIEESNYELMEHSFQVVHKRIADTVLKNEIGFMYYYEMARLGSAKFKNKDYVLPFLNNAYQCNDKDQELQNLILLVFARFIDNNNDVRSVTALIIEFEGYFNFLKSHAGFNSVKANYLLEQCYEQYLLKEYAKGDKALTDFEALCDGNKEIKPTERYVE